MVAIASITIPSHSVLDTVLDIFWIEFCRAVGCFQMRGFKDFGFFAP